MSRDGCVARSPSLVRRALVLTVAALGATLGCNISSCPEPDAGPPQHVATGHYVLRPGAGVWSDVPDPTVPPELTIDRDAGVVTMTRVADGGRVVARYRIVP